MGVCKKRETVSLAEKFVNFLSFVFLTGLCLLSWFVECPPVAPKSKEAALKALLG